jgi:hypothetical protein
VEIQTQHRALGSLFVKCAHGARMFLERPTGAAQVRAFTLFGWRTCRLGLLKDRKEERRGRFVVADFAFAHRGSVACMCPCRDAEAVWHA